MKMDAEMAFEEHAPAGGACAPERRAKQRSQIVTRPAFSAPRPESTFGIARVRRVFVERLGANARKETSSDYRV